MYAWSGFQRTVTVDDHTSVDRANAQLPSGFISFVEEEGDIVSIFSGERAAPIMTAILQNLGAEMHPRDSPD